jgi:hypothetical protein
MPLSTFDDTERCSPYTTHTSGHGDNWKRDWCLGSETGLSIAIRTSRYVFRCGVWIRGIFAAAFAGVCLSDGYYRDLAVVLSLITSSPFLKDRDINLDLANFTFFQASKLTDTIGAYPPRHCPVRPHWHEQEPPPALRCVRSASYYIVHSF